MLYVIISVCKYEARVTIEIILQKQGFVFKGGMKHLLFLSLVIVATSRLIFMLEGGKLNEVSKLNITKDGRLKFQNVKIKFHVSFHN
jgi:ABC-type phosphonate transport system ATPase subunit